jgi:hypothetical protein
MGQRREKYITKEGARTRDDLGLLTKKMEINCHYTPRIIIY